jgi:signal transduction histidine kinase
MAAAPRGGKSQITVSLSREPDAAVLRLADNGPGLPERALTNLFQPFVGSARHGGTGLGLAISRELALAHGGDLTLASTGPEGTVFELRLPAPAEEPPKPRAPRKAKA